MHCCAGRLRTTSAERYGAVGAGLSLRLAAAHLAAAVAFRSANDRLENLEALILKEFTLDSLARNQAQKLQQQLTSDMIKMIGGQLPGQNGEIPIIQNYSDHYLQVMDEAAGGIIFGPASFD